jgi:hypothetical protein
MLLALSPEEVVLVRFALQELLRGAAADPAQLQRIRQLLGQLPAVAVAASREDGAGFEGLI